MVSEKRGGMESKIKIDISSGNLNLHTKRLIAQTKKKCQMAGSALRLVFDDFVRGFLQE